MYLLPVSGTAVAVEFDPDALRARYARELEDRAGTKAPRQIHHAGDSDAVGEDPWSTREPREAITESSDAIVIGGGFSGLLLAARLKEAGVESVRIIETAGDFGGTWYWNRYPGAQCDIESYIYFPLLEETGYMPTSRYPYAPEILEHAQRIGKHFDLYDKALFHTAATEARWDDATQRWSVRTDRGDVLTARFLIRSSGALGAPQFPAIDGLESFTGRIFHSSRWDYAYTGGSPTTPLDKLADKRVVVVGSGASAVQIVPALAGSAEHVYVVQRTPGPAWGDRDITPTDEEWYRNQPTGWQQKRIANYDANTSGHPQPVDLVGDQFVRFFRTLMATAENVVDDPSFFDRIAPEEIPAVFELADLALGEERRAYVDRIVEDPETAERLKPWFGAMCKRVTYDDGYLASFNRADVTLVDAPVVGIERIDGNIVVAGGRSFEADCIVLATGFDAGTSTERRTGMSVFGRDGLSLTEHFAHGLRTLHGFMSDGFPNHFATGQVQGAVALNFTSLLDLQARYIADVVSHAVDGGYDVVEPTPEAVEDWIRTVIESADITREYYARCIPGYYNGYESKDQGVFSGQVYAAGIHAYRTLLDEWTATGQYAGLTFTRARARD